MHDIGIVVGNPLISDGTSGSHHTNTAFEPSNQVHQWTAIALLITINYETITQAAVAAR